ncbi:putative ribonuclease H-like domain-containing protein [Tanacetum coccineum]
MESTKDLPDRLVSSLDFLDFLQNKKLRDQFCNDGGNIGDGVKIAGEVIGSSDEIGVSTEDAIRSSLVFETNVKGSTGSSSSAQNVTFVSSKSTSSTNDVSIAYGATTSFGYNSQRENSSSYTDELMHSFFANQSSSPQLDHKDLEHIDEFDLEEMDLKWQVAMISMRLKKFYKKIGKKLQFDAKEPVGFDKTKVECFNCHKTGHFARECKSKGNQDIRRRDAGNTIYKAKDNRRDLENRRNLKLWFMKIYLDDKTDVLAYHKKLLAEAVKEKEELKTKLEKWQNSSKSLNKLLDSQMSVKEKIGLGFSEQVKENELYDEALMSVFDRHSSDIEDAPVYDRFAKVEGMHAVPPLMTGNYMPPKFDFGIDESYVETLESMPEPVVFEPKVVSQPKVWSDAPIIEKYELDSDDEYVIKSLKEQETPSFAFVNTVKHVKTPRETVKEQNTCNQNCDFHEKRMAKQVELNKQKSKGTGQRENRPLWNNEQRLNHQNKFVPKAVLTKTGRFPVNAARQNLSSQAAATSTARKVNTARSIVNDIRPRNNFYKSHSPIKRPFNRTTTPKYDFSNQKVNTAGDKAVSVVGGIRETAVKTSAGCNWRSKRHYWNKFSKYNGGSNSRKCDDPQQTLKGKGIVDSGCSRHMTRNKAYLLASPKQTALGKDFLNPLMADSLPKTIWLSIHHVVAMKHWLFQSKRFWELCFPVLVLLVLDSTTSSSVSSGSRKLESSSYLASWSMFESIYCLFEMVRLGRGVHMGLSIPFWLAYVTYYCQLQPRKGLNKANCCSIGAVVVRNLSSCVIYGVNGWLDFRGLPMLHELGRRVGAGGRVQLIGGGVRVEVGGRMGETGIGRKWCGIV